MTMMYGNIALVTGANGGMGKAIATGLARRGATVVMISRDCRKGEEARAEIAALTGSASLDLLVADLSSQQAVRQLAEEFQRRYSSLHVLVNNAGAHIQQRQVSVDGIEMNLAINHLSAFLLTNLLLNTMRASAPARIVNVASNAMTRSINLDDLQSEQTFVPFDVYGQAKLAMVLFVHLPSGPFDAWESHGHVGAEPIDRVVGPSGVDRRDGKVGPLRKLRHEQPAHESDVDVHLIDMHFASGHEHLTLSGRWRVF
jgi:NAD(P)-dependent dehydrogenase (short-subunit alcohol dehydrogenase family)